MSKKIKGSYLLNAVGVALVFALLTGLFAANAFGTSTTYIQGICTTACYTIIMVTSLNLVVGFMGEFSLGHAGFVSVGAYVSAIVSGVLDGRALKAGDVLPIGAAPAMVEQRWQQICAKGANRPLGTARTPARPWRFLGGRKLPLFRAVPGPQTDAFTAVGQAAFVHGVYALTADCDRMACKLQGPQIETVDGSDIVSDGIVAGSVQVSANGQPIVMLADHQTTGGYAKIATVISADLSAMAQLRPGEKLAFQYVTAAQAVAGARAQAAVLDKIRERMK